MLPRADRQDEQGQGEQSECQRSAPCRRLEPGSRRVQTGHKEQGGGSPFLGDGQQVVRGGAGDLTEVPGACDQEICRKDQSDPLLTE